MAYDVPRDAINKLQILLRNKARIPSYDPNDPSIPPLRSFEDSISQVDPSPPYLRCKHCKGRLLRGINSVSCVFCGKEQFGDILPDPINFKSTHGYRWLLDSLKLDGSETVAPSPEANESNRGQSITEDSVLLSDLLNLEFRWCVKSEESGNSSANGLTQAKSSLNLAGVDLDNFFSEAKAEINPIESQEKLKVNQKNDSIAFHGDENLSLFNDVQPFAAPFPSMKQGNDKKLSGWEADFLSADSESAGKVAISLDPRAGSSADLSVHRDTLFDSGKESKGTNEDGKTLSSKMDDWFQDDPTSHSGPALAGHSEELKIRANASDSWAMDTTKHSSENIDWIEDNQLLTGGNSMGQTERVHDSDDSLDAWDEFTSSTGPTDVSSLKLTGDSVIPSHQSLEMDLFSASNTSQNLDFGSFLQPDLFPSSLNPVNESIGGKMKSETSWLGSEAKGEITPTGSEGHFGTKGQGQTAENNAFHGQETLSFFENVQPSIRTVQRSKDENENTVSVWDVEFQSADSEALHKNSSSFDPFVGSPVDFSSHMNDLFGFEKQSRKDAAKVASPSSFKMDDWFGNNLSSYSDPGSNGHGEGSEGNDKASGVMDAPHSSSTNIGWFHDDQWETGANGAPHIDHVDDNDSFDAWNDFMSSSSPADSIWKPSSDLGVHSQQPLEMFSSNNNSQNVNVNNALQPDIFSGLSGNVSDSTSENVHSKASGLERADNLDANTKCEDIAQGQDVTSETVKADKIKMLMSQMPDLSFMLDSNLSIPPRLERSTSED